MMQTVGNKYVAQMTQLPRVNIVGNKRMDSGLGVIPMESLRHILEDEGVVL